MKKCLKKVMLSLLAGVMCTTSMVGGISASADTTYEKTYRCFFDVPINSKVSSCTFDMYYSKNMSGVIAEDGNLGGSVKVYGGGSPGQAPLICHLEYTSTGTLTNAGKIFSFKIYSNGNFEDNVSGSYYTSQNISGVTLSPDPVTFSVVQLGDVNLDGVVSSADYAITKNSILGSNATVNNVSTRAADIDGDGVVTSDDAALIQKYLLGLITQL